MASSWGEAGILQKDEKWSAQHLLNFFEISDEPLLVFGTSFGAPISLFAAAVSRTQVSVNPAMVTVAMDLENDPVLAKVCAYFDTVLILASWVSTLSVLVCLCVCILYNLKKKYVQSGDRGAELWGLYLQEMP